MKIPSKIKPGEAAARLLELRKHFRSQKRTYRTKPISENVKDYLYNKNFKTLDL